MDDYLRGDNCKQLPLQRPHDLLNKATYTY